MCRHYVIKVIIKTSKTIKLFKQQAETRFRARQTNIKNSFRQNRQVEVPKSLRQNTVPKMSRQKLKSEKNET